MCIDECRIARITARQTPAFRRHRIDERGGADENVVKVHVIHRRRDAGGNRFVVKLLRQRVIRFDEAIDDPRQTPVIVFTFLHHDAVDFRALGAEPDECANHVGKARLRVETARCCVHERQIAGVIFEQRLHRRFPQRFLRTEVISDQATLHAGRRFDFTRADCVVTAFREERDRGRHQTVPRHLGAFLDQFAGGLFHRRA
jgi:hypothetical protein